MTQRFSRRMEVLIAAFLLLFVSACRDELPTAPGEGLFPRVLRGETYLLEVNAADFLEEARSFTDYTGPGDVGYLMVANRFGGELQAHSLIRLTDFPTTISYFRDGTAHDAAEFVYSTGQLLAPIDTAGSTGAEDVEFQLWTLQQDWDEETVSWQFAEDTPETRTPWTQPGGTRGRLLSTTSWIRGDTLLGDTLSFALDSLAVTEMASEGFPGVLVTANGAPTRVKLGAMLLRTAARPSLHPDTAIAQTIFQGPQTFVFTPEPPALEDVWQVGGIRSSRVNLRLNLGRRFPCPRITGAPPCAAAGDSLRLFEVAVNQVSLRLDPLPVQDGFRVLTPVNLVLRAVAEPELGRLAPLGQPVTQATVQPGVFDEGAERAPIQLPLLAYLSGLPVETDRVNLALLAEPEAANFGLARFSPQLRLRVVYTLPLTPVLP